MDVYFLRHGDAEPAKPGSSDSERNLTAEGQEQVRAVVELARDAGLQVEVIVSSPYVRALQSARIAAEVLGAEQEPVPAEALAPGGTPFGIWDEIRLYPQVKGLLLVGHEPLISETISTFLGCSAVVVDVKKGALVALELSIAGTRPRGMVKWILTPALAFAARRYGTASRGTGSSSR